MFDPTFLALCQGLSLLMSATFFGYVFLILVPYLRAPARGPGSAEFNDWHLFVPCRDEEAVIGQTIEYLTSTFPRADIWIIDDASEDETGAIARGYSYGNPRVHVVQRHLPNAREGKGAALNAAYDQLVEHLGYPLDASGIIVGVVDADGKPDPNCLDVVSAKRLFGNPKVGGVQIEVRMTNCEEQPPLKTALGRWLGRLLVRMQDVEFRSVIAAVQHSRRNTNTVGLGGNGQFTRLSALDQLNAKYGRPWHGSLLEDFELGVHLLLLGWRNAYTADTYVEQEGLYSFSRFIVQRTRWSQGVMQCIKYLPQLWASRKVSNSGALETAYYLIQPWLTLLGTVVYTVPVAAFVHVAVSTPGFLGYVVSGWIGVLLLMYAFFGIGVMAMWGIVYWRKFEPQRGLLTAIGWGFSYFLYVYGFYLTSWRALFRILSRRNGWAKTRRNTEALVGTIALDR